MNIKFPFLLSVRNRFLVGIPLVSIMMVTMFGPGPFSVSYTLRLLILSVLFFIFGFIGGYKSQSSDPAVRHAWESSRKFSNISLPLISSVTMANRYYASHIPHALPIIYLTASLFFIPLFTFLFVGEHLGRRLFLRHYPEFAYFTEPPEDESECSMENK